MTDFEAIDRATVEREVQEMRGALFDDTVAMLCPAVPVCLRESPTVH